MMYRQTNAAVKPRLEWARFVITSDAEADNIGIAAHVVLAELERLEKGKICRKCGLRKNDEEA